MENKFGFDHTNLIAFSGYYTDDSKIRRSASGGVATALSEIIINNGGEVFGAVYSKDYKSALFACVDKTEDLEPLRSSKYFATEKKCFINGKLVNVYEEVANHLRNDKIVLFIGLGCDVAALLKYIEKNKVDSSKLYTIDLICHGPTYQEIQKDYIENLEKKYQSKVTAFSSRYKKNGWKPPYIHVEFENGKVFEELLYESDFGYAFKIYSRSSCYQCKFKGKNHLADVTIGDYWGCKSGMDTYNPNGVSILFSRTEKGKNIIEELGKVNWFKLQNADINLALEHNTMFYKCRPKNEKQYEEFTENFKNHGLHYAVTHSSGYGAYRNKKIKRIIKDIIPENLLNIIQRFRALR